jgi:3-oxoacyl-[acyl-carrier-protein] synthase II
MGVVCPLGLGIEHVWRRLINGESGIGRINAFNTDTVPCRIAGQIPQGGRLQNRLDIDEWIPRRRQAKMGRFSHLALIAASEAVEDAGWEPSDEDGRCATGVSIGSACGGLQVMHDAWIQGHQKLGYRLPTMVLRSGLINQAASAVAETACATGVHAIGDAARMILMGDADVMVAGGTEAAVSEIGIAGFCASRALSTGFNDTPTKASRPWDQHRDGFVMSEGAAIVVLEELDHARKRGARIYAEFCGYGLSGDAHHVTTPSEGHDGALRAMRSAMRHAGAEPTDIHYVNAHGTSTPIGDDLELEAVERLLGHASKKVAMSSTKSATGHLLGAAGAIEIIFSVLAIRDGVVPPTLNLDEPSRETPIDRVANVAQERTVRTAMSNSFGFGGINASIVFRAAA